MEDVLAIMAEINKKHGAGTAVLASEIADPVPRFPSGSLGLDLILGGGWPANQWIELIGNESSGKTAVALKTVASNQERDPNFATVWIASEKWMPEYADMCGVDPRRVAVVETNSMEMAYETAVKFAESRAVDCVIIDSLPALVPSAEDEKDIGQPVVGRGAIVTGQFFRKVGGATKRSLIEAERPVLGIVINQWRSMIGVMHGDPRTTPGGLAKNYAYSVRAEVKRGEWIEIGSGDSKERIGQAIQIRTIKNKSAAPQKVAVIDFYFSPGGDVKAGDYDFAKEIVSLAVMEGIIERGGSIYRFDSEKWKGQAAMLQGIREDVGLYERIREEVVATLSLAAK